MAVTFTKKKPVNKQLAEKTRSRRKFHAAETVMRAVTSSPSIANDLVPKLKSDMVPLDQLRPAKRRIRKAGRDHVASVAKCIKAVGQVSPIIVDRDFRIVDGHVVVEALRALGETMVSVICLDHLDEAQLKLVQIGLNKLSEGSTWELEGLKVELEELHLVGYDLTTTGFTLPELDIILQDGAAAPGDADLAEVPAPPTNAVSRLGDLWHLGDHLVLCGDARDELSYSAVLGSHKADAAFVDCPWNLPAKQISSKHGDFKMGAGEMSDEAFQEFVDTFNRLIAEHLADGGVLYSCIDWRSHDKIVLGAERAGLTHINTIVWNKGSGGQGGLYRSAHELIPLFCKGKTPKTNNVELGRHGRDRTNVWSYPGANRAGSSAGMALKHHPTPKPIEMVEDALLDVTSRGELVLDTFLGSGTTLLAAERAGRVAAGIELDPAYVDVCIRRWKDMTGADAVHAETGLTFAELAAARDGEDFEEGGQ